MKLESSPDPSRLVSGLAEQSAALLPLTPEPGLPLLDLDSFGA